MFDSWWHHFLSNRNVAQLVAHYVRDVGVGRSSRLIPTKLRVAFWITVSYPLILFSRRDEIGTAMAQSETLGDCVKILIFAS